MQHEQISKLHQGLTVSLIASALRTYRMNDDLKQAYEEMQQFNYDFAGYSDKQLGGATAIIEQSAVALSTTDWADAAKPIDVELLISEYTSIRDAMPRIVEHGHLLVIGEHGIDQLVTTADLNKQPVRMLLFSVISTLETHLLDWIRSYVPDEATLSEFLTPERLGKTLEKYQELESKNEDIDLFHCLEFSDKATIIRKLGLPSFIGVCVNNTKMRDFFKAARDLRDSLCHAADPDQIRSWAEVLAMLETAEQLLKIQPDSTDKS